ncbi:lysylphosphatidylglycerol synthase transmembrane domain-containing protein [Mangrovitalea sediminis]|uniref:lysylphosphatidylglycerol synthase transmembrane domain-containing protein n=1 Tax=Mangrovitalea sediminis TaxID=1982043 RepID=UPI0013046357|nr:lysylphosphatidylglycerol synthase transmembrane domain-containing protein [Mangrovitalea sediminis]
MKRWYGLTLAAVVAAAAVPALIGGSAAFRQLAGVSPHWILLMLGLVLVGWNLNAWRLRLLLGEKGRNLRHHQAFSTVLATECGFNATPGGSGAPFILAAMLKRHQVRASEASAVFVIDQMTDLLFFLCILPALLLYGLNHYLDFAPTWLLGAIGATQVALIITAFSLFRYHRLALKRSGALLERLGLKRSVRLRWARSQLRFNNAVRTTLRLSPYRLMLTFVLCAGHWLLRYSVLYVAVIALGHPIDWGYTFFVQMMSMAAGHLTLLPGGAGGTELSSAALLAPYLTKSTAAAAILIWRCITYYFYLLAGGIVLMGVAGWRFWQRQVPGQRQIREIES